MRFIDLSPDVFSEIISFLTSFSDVFRLFQTGDARLKWRNVVTLNFRAVWTREAIWPSTLLSACSGLLNLIFDCPSYAGVAMPRGWEMTTVPKTLRKLDLKNFFSVSQRDGAFDPASLDWLPCLEELAVHSLHLREKFHVIPFPAELRVLRLGNAGNLFLQHSPPDEALIFIRFLRWMPTTLEELSIHATIYLYGADRHHSEWKWPPLLTHLELLNPVGCSIYLFESLPSCLRTLKCNTRHLLWREVHLAISSAASEQQHSSDEEDLEEDDWQETGANASIWNVIPKAIEDVAMDIRSLKHFPTPQQLNTFVQLRNLTCRLIPEMGISSDDEFYGESEGMLAEIESLPMPLYWSLAPTSLQSLSLILGQKLDSKNELSITSAKDLELLPKSLTHITANLDVLFLQKPFPSSLRSISGLQMPSLFNIFPEETEDNPFEIRRLAKCPLELHSSVLPDSLTSLHVTCETDGGMLISALPRATLTTLALERVSLPSNLHLRDFPCLTSVRCGCDDLPEGLLTLPRCLRRLCIVGSSSIVRESFYHLSAPTDLPPLLTSLVFERFVPTQRFAEWIEGLPGDLPWKHLALPCGYDDSPTPSGIPPALRTCTSLETLRLSFYATHKFNHVNLENMPRRVLQLEVYSATARAIELRKEDLQHLPKTLQVIKLAERQVEVPKDVDWEAMSLPAPIVEY